MENLYFWSILNSNCLVIFKGLSKPFYKWVNMRWKVAKFVAKN
jgi:hypothetical protein